VPRGESLAARQLTLRITKGIVELSAFTAYQKAAADGQYASAMSGYLMWLAPRYHQIRATLEQEKTLLRNKARVAGHARTPGIVADLALGWRYFLDFAVERTVLTQSERQIIETDAWEYLMKAAAEQCQEILEHDPGKRFLALLASSIASGRVHVTDRAGKSPQTCEAWGWRLESTTTPECWKPQGRQVGWVDGDDLFLDPEAAFAEVQKLAEESVAVAKPGNATQANGS
jgi:hypothetical protein